MNIRGKLRRWMRTLTGRDLVPYLPAYSPEARLIRILEAMRIDTILDVGAGRGEFGKEVLANGFKGTVISVEPQQGTYDDLLKVTQRHARWMVLERCAAGREDSEGVLHVTRRSGSSSLRQPALRHALADPDSVEIRQDRVKVRRLDQLVAPHLSGLVQVFLKLDVQGTEEDVLEGASTILPRIRGMQIEVSVVQLYEGQKLMPEMLAWAERSGFALWGLSPVYLEGNTGRTLQYDAILCRE